jgi:hypothetical protein
MHDGWGLHGSESNGLPVGQVSLAAWQNVSGDSLCMAMTRGPYMQGGNQFLITSTSFRRRD